MIATGGTIAGAGYSIQTQGASGLIRGVPQLAEIATITAEDPFTIPSSRITPQMMFELAQKVRAAFAEDRNLAGVVITHGTDSLEETAFFFDLVVGAERPVVFTGAMRTRDERGADGSRNLLNAVRLAATPATRGLGVLVTLNDEFHGAREIRKLHSTALDAFESPAVGRLGYLEADEIFLLQKPLRRAYVKTEAVEPRVDLIVATTGSDGHQIRGAVDAGAQGIVVELFGRGNAPPAMGQAMTEARKKGVTVVCTTRTREGGLKESKFWREVGILSAEDLDGIKARLVLVAALGATRDTAVLQGYFDKLSGKVGG